LSGVISLMGTNQREGARSDTQRDAQAAIDYMSRDLREAIYVYDGRCLSDTAANDSRVELVPSPAAGQPATYCSALLNFLPTRLKAADQLPVLAFWRVNPLPDPHKNFCELNAKTWVSPTVDKDRPFFSLMPCASRTTYSLVVYSLDWSDPGKIWRGRARLKRYELPQYKYTTAVNFDTEPAKGWVSPLDKKIGFPQWPLSTADDGKITSAQTTGLPTDDNAVLIDFMDDVKFTGTDTANCPTEPAVVLPPGTSAPAAFTLSPTTTLATGDRARRSIYACVRGGAGAGLNQEVIIRLQANAAGRPGVPKIGSSLPITMETRVLSRGVLNKGN
jgi:hypothetical protein